MRIVDRDKYSSNRSNIILYITSRLRLVYLFQPWYNLIQSQQRSSCTIPFESIHRNPLILSLSLNQGIVYARILRVLRMNTILDQRSRSISMNSVKLHIDLQLNRANTPSSMANRARYSDTMSSYSIIDRETECTHTYMTGTYIYIYIYIHQ